MPAVQTRHLDRAPLGVREVQVAADPVDGHALGRRHVRHHHRVAAAVVADPVDRVAAHVRPVDELLVAVVGHAHGRLARDVDEAAVVGSVLFGSNT